MCVHSNNTLPVNHTTEMVKPPTKNNAPIAIRAIPHRPRTKGRGSPPMPFLSLFAPATSTTSQNTLLDELMISGNRNQLLWYPSAGADMTDVNNITRIHFRDDKEIQKNTPTVFVHTDYSDHVFAVDPLYGQRLLFDNNSDAVLVKNTREGVATWLFLVKINNYDFLASILRNKISVSVIYTACDGVTSGLGAGKFAISTYYLTRFYRHLGVTYHITEYSRQYYLENAGRVLKNLDSEVPALIESYPEINEIPAPTVPESFIDLQERPITSFSSRTGPLVLRYCKVIDPLPPAGLDYQQL